MALAIYSTLLLAVALVGPQIPGAASGSSEAGESVCEIRQHPDAYLGKVVTVSATYRTDSIHYEYLIDLSCSTQSTLDIGFAVPERDSSVEAFERAQVAECKRLGHSGLCILEGAVVMRGEIAEAKGTHLQPNLVHLIINPHSVLSFDFRSER